MTFEETKSMIEETGLPVAYDHFAEGESPDPPFICFLFPGSDNLFADNTVFQKIDELNVELYTDRKDPDMETRIEDILNSHELPFEKSEVWIAEERMNEVLYQTQIIGG
ncbi:hypothetical protein B6259_09560 [Ruminococcaceae bacterium CPB6]|jgi:NADPH-dependent ferric siderophore reductase|nr:hypothetical protein B6259_09560 [Ruminococcaceae bacterium CPB6]